MCVVSMVVDHYGNNWTKPIISQPSITYTMYDMVTKLQYDQLVKTLELANLSIAELRREVENMRRLLIKAKIYDQDNNEPDCAKDDKIEVVKAVAKALGVDLPEDLFK